MNEPNKEMTPQFPTTTVFPELPGWVFDVTEVAVGVHRVFCRDCAGRNIEGTGLDPDALIEKCRQAALDIMAGPRTSGECGLGVTEGESPGA